MKTEAEIAEGMASLSAIMNGELSRDLLVLGLHSAMSWAMNGTYESDVEAIIEKGRAKLREIAERVGSNP